MLRCNSSKHGIKCTDMPETLEEREAVERDWGKVVGSTLQAFGIENPIQHNFYNFKKWAE